MRGSEAGVFGGGGCLSRKVAAASSDVAGWQAKVEARKTGGNRCLRPGAATSRVDLHLLLCRVRHLRHRAIHVSDCSVDLAA
jgi:hypothetical protein